MRRQGTHNGLVHVEAAYRAHHELLRRTLRRRVDDENDVADLTQEAFLRVMRYDQGDVQAVKPLLLRVALNLAVSHHREAHRRHTRDRDTPEKAALAAPAPPLDEQLACRQRLERGLRMIEGLPTRCREVFELSRLEGWRQGDIARHLGISVGMVEKHMARARKALRVDG